MKNPVSDDPKKQVLIKYPWHAPIHWRTATVRSVRGGSAHFHPGDAVSVTGDGPVGFDPEWDERKGRYYEKPSSGNMDIGFRVVRNKPKSKK
ncbi:hypothetical protein CMI47_06775 [Candidatus Pacearchaeota archaeon]|nr:hypothetical protein [Candidatus Pacearchaeota archaeon]|tara:strand:- start:112 stop:387 length:276 start_codon:yes stop_codon:yes gene_type:complete